MAKTENPCQVFSNTDFSNHKKLADEVYNNTQKHFGIKLTLKEENLTVKICQNEIRNYSKEQIVLLIYFATVHYELTNFEKASILFEEVLLFSEQLDFWMGSAFAHDNLGAIANLNDLKMSSYFHFQKSLEIGEAYDQPYYKIIANLNLGVFNFSIGSYPEAEKYYKSCLDFLEKNPNDNIKHWAIHRMGELKRNDDQLEQAIILFNLANKYWKETENEKGICFTNLQLGLIYTEMDPPKALKYFNESLEKGALSEYTRCQKEVLMNLGYFYFSQNKFSQALNTFQMVLENSKKDESVPRRMNAYKAIAKIYSHQGKLSKSNESYEAYLKENQKYLGKISDSNNKSLEDVERLIMQKKEYDLLLQKERYTKESVYFQKKITFFSVLSTLLAGWLAISFFRKNKKNKEQKKVLHILNEKNKQQAEELTIAKAITENQKKDLEIQMVKKAIVLSQQGEMIKSIEEKLEEMKSSKDTNSIRKKISKVKDNSLWTELNLQINQSNKVFFEKLLENYPKLTQSDLRLCAFLKMNMNTKEIANLTFKNPESVKVARSRLRKKLGLTHSNINFNTFFNQIK